MKMFKSRSRTKLLKIINDLEQRPHDKIRILGDAGITVIAAGLGAAAAGTIASAAGVTSIFGVTTVASWVGISVSMATPVGWTIAATVASGAAAYGITRLIRGGGLAEGRKTELLERYRAELAAILAKEEAGSVSDQDRTSFVISLRDLIEHDILGPDHAFRLIEQVERGTLSLSHAMQLISALLAEAKVPSDLPNESAVSPPPRFVSEAPAPAPLAEDTHVVVANKVEDVSMGLGITSGIVAAGASLAAPAGLSAIGVALGITSAPLIVTAAPVITTVATAASVVSGTVYFYSKWKSRARKKGSVDT